MPMVLAVRAMLLGYAIECSLKMLWRRRGNKIIKDGRFVGVPGVPDHDLLKLARAAGFTPTAADADVLQHLTKFIKFAGRYPVAKTPDANRPQPQRKGPPVDIAYFSKQDFRRCITILNKVTSIASGKKRPAFRRFVPFDDRPRERMRRKLQRISAGIARA
jgi:hypothetical protein